MSRLHLNLNNTLDDFWRALPHYRAAQAANNVSMGTHLYLLQFIKNNYRLSKSLKNIASEIYRNACKKRPCDSNQHLHVQTHTVMIIIAGRYQDSALLSEAYDTAQRTNCIDVMTHNAVIMAANKTQQYDIRDAAFARATMPEAPDHERATAATYSSMITAIAENQCNLLRIQTLYQTAREKKLYDETLHRSVISAIQNHGYIGETALQLLKSASDQMRASERCDDTVESSAAATIPTTPPYQPPRRRHYTHNPYVLLLRPTPTTTPTDAATAPNQSCSPLARAFLGS